MPLQKQSVPINFGQGLDTKTDPLQVPVGKFLALQNIVFDKGGLLEKRNGYKALASLPDDTYTYTTTFNGNLTAVGTSLAAYSSGPNSWTNKGSIQPVDLDTLTLIRSNLDQTQCDSAISPSGLICTVYTDTGGAAGTQYKYAIADSVTGQNIVAPTIITSGAGSVNGAPRVFVLVNYFIIVFNVSARLQYIAVSIPNPSLTPAAAADIATNYAPGSRDAFDGVVLGNYLYLAWNGTDGGGAIKYTSIDVNFNIPAATSVAGKVATIMSLSADSTKGYIYASFWDAGGSTGYVLAFDTNLNSIMTSTQWLATGSVVNVASAAQSGTVTIFYEVPNTYTYDTSIATNYIKSVVVTAPATPGAGSVGSPVVVVRSVGIASKAFILNSQIYLLSLYVSAYQPTYFLINSSGKVASKLAYSNGPSAYLTKGLPSVTISDDTASISYLIRDLLVPVNKTQGNTVSAGSYAQSGVNLVSFSFGTSSLATAEIGQNLNISGGFLWGYDGFVPTESNFHLWPDSIEPVGLSTVGGLIAQQYFYVATYEWSDNQGNIFRSAPSIPASYTIAAAPASFTGNRTSGSAILASVSSTSGLAVGQAISGTGIPAATYILSIDSSSQITMSANATSGTATATTVTPVTLTSLKVNVPTLRLTYKTAASNPVKIVLYRWSVAQETYYQVTSITAPTLNDTTIDYVTISDTLADSAIIGNSILYTTGGVVENIAAPATSVMALYKSRLFLVDSEDKNLLWYSKQVIESTPVEMSDLFTIYVAPTISAQGNTGPITALSSLDDKLIVFKKDAIYYLVGTGPDNTGANNDFSDPTFVTSTVGCANPNSIVFIPQGLMFQSDKGIWLVSRDLSTSYIGAPVEQYNDNAVKSAVNIPGTNQVRMTLDNGVTLMYDYFYGQWGTFNNVPAISGTLFQSLHTYINSSGAVFQENPGSYLDGASPVLISFLTSWFNLTGLQGFERAYFFYLLATYYTPHKLTVSIAYDYNPAPSQSVVINPDNFNGAYGDSQLWGSDSQYGGAGQIEQWRVFFSQQKCQAFQINISESFDGTHGVPAGAGLSISGLNMVVGVKSSYPRLKAARSIG